VPIRSGVAFFLSLLACAFVAAPVASAVTGGTAAAEPSPSPTSPTTAGGASPSSAATHKSASRNAPVTGHSVSLAYKGPVYEKLATGQVVPYVAPPPAGAVAANGGSPVGTTAGISSTTATTADASAGGAPPASGAGAADAADSTSTDALPAKPELLVPGSIARVVNGLAAAPMNAPATVQAIIWAGNQIIGLPYIYGGGHGSFISPGYDCSGTVSYALHGASLLSTPMDSGEFMSWGGAGVGQWVTVFTNPGHAYMTVAGLRLDTSAVDDPTNQQGPRWRPLRPGNPGFTVRHPIGL
jgi:cell wall-associated NlpC family hydrolase